MKRYVFSPHVGGWGHRVRVDSIARRVVQADPDCRVTVLVRPDDATDPRTWTQFPTASSTVARTRSIYTADVLVQDGAWKYDIRVQAMQRRGGRYILIGQPYRIDMSDSLVRQALRAAEKIIVPWPSRLFELTGVLADFKDKVVNVEPIVNVERDPIGKVEQMVVYVAISRGSPKLLSMVRACIERVFEGCNHDRVEIAGGLGRFLPRGEHSRLFLNARLVISQAPTAVFEAMAAGIPVLMLPLKGNQEHERLAVDLGVHEAGIAIREEDLTEENLTRAIQTLLMNEDYRRTIVSNGLQLVPT